MHLPVLEGKKRSQWGSPRGGHYNHLEYCKATPTLRTYPRDSDSGSAGPALACLFQSSPSDSGVQPELRWAELQHRVLS